ncbi:ankyrin-1-like [Schistocerca americana]|uniref:ankyrin-1-like n=1 Tax=Schistocerca americana TaxID=7009 RepID=UPI001F4F56B9|nr:ankyrin-1-like [Schistocerca americana]
MTSEQKWRLEDVFKWSPIRFAEETNAWEWIERMLENGLSAKELITTKRKLSDLETAVALMHVFCTGGYLRLLRLALSVDPRLSSTSLDGKGSTPLHVAAANRRDAAVRLLLDAGADWEERDGLGRTPLHVAAASGSIHAFRLLLDAGVDPEVRDSEGNTAVHFASEAGHTGILKALYGRGVSRCLVKLQLLLSAESCNVEGVRLALKQTSSWGGAWSDLHCVAIKGSGTAVRTMLTAGVDPNARDANGDTPLHAVAAAGCPGAAEALVEAGADVDAADSSGSTPLHYAVRVGNLGVARVLLAAGANVEARDAEGDTFTREMEISEDQLSIEEVRQWTPLRFAEETCAWTWVEKFLQRGVPLRYLEATRRKLQNVYSATDVVRTACVAGLLHLLQYALSVDPSLAKVRLDAEGTTPLHVAAAHRRVAVVRVLVDAGADIDCKTGNGRTPLHAAASVGAADTVLILLKYGAHLRETDRDGKTAMQLATENGHLHIAKSMEIHGGNVNKIMRDLIRAGQAGDVKTVRELLPLSTQAGPGEWTHLHWGTIRGTTTLLNAYLAAGMDPNVSDRHGNTPLHIAAARRPPAFSAALIAAGADIDAADSTGSTALHYAVRTGNIPTVRLLLESGARHDLRDNDGDSPLHRAVSRGSLETVSALLEAGARTDAKDAQGETPYDLARRYGYTDLLRLLRLMPSGSIYFAYMVFSYSFMNVESESS